MRQSPETAGSPTGENPTEKRARMILKKLEIQGFKSFPERTEILFTPGVTAVVGPNGSGKSNISDAILWVLGEQNVRNLRGQKAQDVIFSGTGKRRATGMAEVSLTIDNSSNKLPLNYSEVTVTRRAYRTGDSEFFINKTSCRLKDIYELFLDTGVGREAYSIVSQGEIDAILSANPEDRRALFDEAAGIKKYRYRKKEAERKLDATEQNLSRVNDIIHEINTQIEPMAEQAKQAEVYIDLTTRLREIEIGILVNDIQRFSAEAKRLKIDIENCGKSISDADAMIVALEEEKTALSTDLANADAQVERFSSVYQDAVTRAERAESRLALADQKHANAEISEKLLSEEIREIEARIVELKEKKNSLEAEYKKSESREDELSTQIGRKMAEMQALREKIAAAVKDVEEQKAGYIELAKNLAAQKNELSNAAVREESLKNLLFSRTNDLKEAEHAANKADAEKNAADKEAAEVREKLSEVEAGLRDASRLLGEKREEESALSAELERLGRLIVDRESRLKTLEEMEEAREGYFLGVRSVMAAAKKGDIKGKFSVVADVIKVPDGYESAYESALGSSIQDIITETENEAKAAIAYLKSNKAGKATFLPLNMMRNTVSPMLKELAGKNGIIGLANELLKFDKKYSPAIDALLAKVLVAKDIDSAIAASRSAVGWSKIVTLGGELVFPSGAMAGGHAPGKTANILGRKQEIESLKREVSELSAQSESAGRRAETIRDERTKAADRLVALEEQDTSLKMSLLEKERRLEFALRDGKRLDGDRRALLEEVEDIRENLRKARETQKTLAEAIENSGRENSDMDERMAKCEEDIRSLQKDEDALTAEINGINVTMASLSQRRLGEEQSFEDAEKSIREMAAELGRKKERLASALQDKTGTEGIREELVSALETAKGESDDAGTQAEHWKKVKQSILKSSLEVNDRAKEVTRDREGLTQNLHGMELKATRLDMQVSQAAVRLLDEYDVTIEEAHRMDADAIKNGTAAEVLRLRRDIKSMGDVNTGAVQEYARLNERFEFLSGQREDLLEAKEKLTDAIKEIDESTRGVFLETVEAVRQNFALMFDRLFGGGSTDILLTEPDDVLETGLDVIVELPGKKRQNLLLLSGGERAMTAAALLFALMKVRPSPFCILDEVDAPLDESNVSRFTDVIKEFAEKSQMIVITHNKSTMEAADVLYGVSMQEPGISKLVSVKLSEVETGN